MNFSQFGLDPRLKAGIDAMGYVQPTPIQTAAIPEVLAGRDALGVAMTGTGKTAAFMLPILQHLLSGRRGVVRALILAPTRELAEQIHQATRELGRNTGIRSMAIYGGVSKRPQADKLRRGVEIVVACPGRLLDLYGDGELDFSELETLVLDEADCMCDMGFLPDIKRILAKLPPKRQNLFFSATMPPPIRRLADRLLVDPALVTIDRPAPAATVTQSLYPTTEALKLNLLEAILKCNGGRTLVFTRTKHRAHYVYVVLARQGLRVAAMQGNMSQSKRREAIEGFRHGKFDVLVATDIAARGIDVTGIEMVVNYDMPDTLDAYTHRVGRTGRATHSGKAVNLASAADTTVVRMIQNELGTPLEQRVMPDFDYGGFTPRLLIAAQQNRPNGAPGRGGRRSRGGSRSRAPRFC